MPLTEPAPRELIHTRDVQCRGFKRADGNWDIEAHMTDVKTCGSTHHARGEIPAGTPMHEMWVRVSLDSCMTILAIEAVTDQAPFRVCPEITPNFQRLVGLRIGPGFNARVRELVGGPEGCTHLVELMAPIGTTAFQTMSGRYREAEQPRDPNKPPARPPLIDTCHTFASDGELVQAEFPAFYTGPSSKTG